MASNLPPGVTVNMIPGNRPEDFAFEDAEQGLLDKLNEVGTMPDEYKLLSLLAKPIFEIYRQEVMKALEEANVDHARHLDWLKGEIYGMINGIESDERYKEKQFGFDQAHGEVIGYKRVLKLLGEKLDLAI